MIFVENSHDESTCFVKMSMFFHNVKSHSSNGVCVPVHDHCNGRTGHWWHLFVVCTSVFGFDRAWWSSVVFLCLCPLCCAFQHSQFLLKTEKKVRKEVRRNRNEVRKKWREKEMRPFCQAYQPTQVHLKPQTQETKKQEEKNVKKERNETVLPIL